HRAVGSKGDAGGAPPGTAAGGARGERETMNDAIRPVLRDLVQREGAAVYEDPRRCEALLRDLAGEHRSEIFVLVTAVRAAGAAAGAVAGGLAGAAPAAAAAGGPPGAPPGPPPGPGGGPPGPPSGPPGGPAGPTGPPGGPPGPQRDDRRRRRLIPIIALIAIAALITGVVVALSSGKSASADEILAEPVASDGQNPFTASVAG